jgi:tripartite-type tricarboxylate transporter receptor subunit TctC
MEGFVGGNWYGVVAPKGLDPQIRKRLTEVISKISESPAFSVKAAASSLEMRYIATDAFVEFLRAERVRWGEIVEKEHIEVSNSQ